MYKKFLLVIFLTVIIFSFSYNSVFSTSAPAPALYVLAINPKTNKCGLFWAGDEFTRYELPYGWESYFNAYVVTVKTPFGECSVKEGANYTECCKQLGLTTISPDEVIYNKEELTLSDGKTYYCRPPIPQGISFNSGVAINQKTKGCTASLKFNLVHEFVSNDGIKHSSWVEDTDSVCLQDKQWVSYNKTNTPKLSGFFTPYGYCSSNDIETCCYELGFEYQEGNIGKKPFFKNFFSSIFLRLLSFIRFLGRNELTI